MRTVLKAFLTTAGVLLVWHFVCKSFDVPRYILPTPIEVFRFAWANIPILFGDIVVTGIEALSGLILGILFSLAVAIWLYLTPRVQGIFSAITIGAQSVPILAIAPFLTAWFGPGIGSKIVASTVVCVFPLIGGWIAGRNSIAPNEWIFAESVSPTKWVRLWHFLLPRSLPSFVASLKVGCPLSVLGALVGEFVGARQGLGFRVLTGSYYLRTEEMICGVIFACSLSLAFYGAVVLAERKWLFWHGKGAI